MKRTILDELAYLYNELEHIDRTDLSKIVQIVREKYFLAPHESLNDFHKTKIIRDFSKYWNWACSDFVEIDEEDIKQYLKEENEKHN